MAKKLYYPKGQIITGLFTSGKEFQFKGGTEYVGAYHRYVDGGVMSGAVRTAKSQDLAQFVDSTNIDNSVYQSLTNLDMSVYVSPVPTRPIPTDKDYKQGYFTRYVIYPRNDRSKMFEIDAEQNKEWQKSKKGINEIFYNVITLRWKLTGPEFDLIDAQSIVTSGVVDTNRRTLLTKQSELLGITKYFSDLREFSVWSAVTSSEIKAQFS